VSRWHQEKGLVRTVRLTQIAEGRLRALAKNTGRSERDVLDALVRGGEFEDALARVEKVYVEDAQLDSLWKISG
jgi:predicted DNA-binding protein